MARFFIIFLLAATAFLFPVLQSSYSQKMRATDNITRDYNISIARNAASSYASMLLYEIAETFDSVDFQNQSKLNDYLEEFTFTDNNTAFSGTNIVSSLSTQDTGYTLELKVIATKGDVEATFETKTFQIPFSYYGLFLNGSVGGYYYGNEKFWELLDGPMHVNGNFAAGGVPGPQVTGNLNMTGIMKYGYGLSYEKWSRFTGESINTGVDKLNFPNHMNFIDKHNAYDLDNLFSSPYNSSLYIQLGDDASGNGIVDVYAVPYDDPQLADPAYLLANKRTILISDLQDVYGLDENLLFSQKYKIHVQGTLNGQLTIAGWKDFYITDDILLKDDPTVNPDSEDILGLYTKNDLYIASREKEYTNNVYYNENGVDIFANIFTGNSLKIENFSSWKGPKSRGAFRVYGSRSQHKCNATFSGFTNYRGFLEEIIYDYRFRSIAPPGVPWTDNRRLSDFKESYRIIPT
ncbi:MAG: hypothetical protein K8S23_02020 [Candidatus Cloacimonetes bacterium]|nr:hypothetical protein [Candidatus Cloacimonadota bacterium]